MPQRKRGKGFGRGVHKTVLCVGEKPSIADGISKHLSSGAFIETRRGAGTPVHEFLGDFKGERVLYRVTSVTGHIYGTDFVAGVESVGFTFASSLFSVFVCSFRDSLFSLSGFENWEATDPYALFSAGVRKVPQDKGKIVRWHALVLGIRIFFDLQSFTDICSRKQVVLT